MVKKLSTRIISPAIILIIMFSFVSVPVYAATQTYNSTLSFQGEHTGATRTYKYKNISYSATASCNIGKTKIPSSSRYPKTYTVSLYSKTGWFFSEKVGSGSASRYGYSSITWTNVGKGDYYFYFKKARDGVNVKSNNVKMKSYN